MLPLTGWLAQMAPALQDEFHSIMDEQLETIPFDSAACFVEGFRMGMKIAVQVYESPSGRL